MKKTLLLFSIAGLLLQAGTSKVVPAEQIDLHLKVSPRKDGRPHSAPEDGAGLTSQTSLGCLKWVAGAQRKRAETVATTRPSESDSQFPGSGDDRPESTGSGIVLATVKIKGAKDRPVKATFIIGGREESKEGTERKESRTKSAMRHAGTMLEEQVTTLTEGEENEEEGESSCTKNASACCGRIVKFVVGLAACL